MTPASAVARPGAGLLSAVFETGGEHPHDVASERILDAALAVSAASGVRHLTIDEVAARAGVGRMTVYRRFEDRAGLLEALAAREGRRCLAELDAASPADAPLDDQVVAGFVTSLRIVRRHPLLKRLVEHEPEAMLRSLLASDGAMFKMARAFVAARIVAAPDGPAAEVEAEAAAEVLIRLVFSFVLIRETSLPLDDEDSARAVAHRLLAPVVSTA